MRKSWIVAIAAVLVVVIGAGMGVWMLRHGEDAHEYAAGDEWWTCPMH